MNKKILIIFVIFVVLIAFAVLAFSLSSKKQPAPSESLQMTEVQVDSLRTYISNFINLYNSYTSLDNYKSLLSLDSDMTIALQQENNKRLKDLQNSGQSDLTVQTQTLPETLIYSRKSANNIEASIKGVVTESHLRQGNSYNILVNISLIKQDGQWYVDTLNIIKE